MDLRAVRRDICTVAGEAGFNAFSYQPSDLKTFPAAVVGGVRSFVRLNVRVTQVQIACTFYVALTDVEEATRKLDLVLSTGDPNSFVDLLDSVQPDDNPSWRSVRIDSAGAYTQYSFPGGAIALGVEVILELTA